MSTEESVTNYDFLYWQCRIRQQSVRQGDGRPTPGMCPYVFIDDKQLGQIILVISKASPENITAQFKHMVKKTQDPTERWESAIRLFSEMYYQDPKDFSEEMTALFSPGSEISSQLIASGNCVLIFEQNNQRFRVPCKVTDLSSDHPRYQFTFWHNSLFNPSIPGDCKIISFMPEWQEALSEKLA